MDLSCKLVEKSFTDADGKSHAYYVLVFALSDGSDLEVSLKGDKARLLKLSNSNNFWGN